MPDTRMPLFPLAFTRLMEEFHTSFHDFERLHAMQRRNVEALLEVNQLSIEAVQSFARRQADIMEKTTTMFAQAATEILRSDSPTAVAERQIEIARDAFLMTQAELKALTHMTLATRNEVRKIYADRVKDGFDAMSRPAAAKTKGPKN
jgi:hypothetical protein